MKRFLVLIISLVLVFAQYGCSHISQGPAGGACQAPPTMPETRSEPPFYFVQITDTHFGEGDHFERTERIVEAVNRLPMKIEFVVHTGDITMDRIQDRETLHKGIAVLRKLAVPVYFVPGNHDIPADGPEETGEFYADSFGPLSYVKQVRGVNFVFIYTEPLKGSPLHEDDPLRRLENHLQAGGGRPTIIFHHRPCVNDFHLNEVHPGWDPDFRERWVRLINSYHVKAVVAGHFHRDEHHWLGDVPLYVSAPVAGYWGRQASYRIYEYFAGKLSYTTQYIELP